MNMFAKNRRNNRALVCDAYFRSLNALEKVIIYRRLVLEMGFLALIKFRIKFVLNLD